MKLDFSVLWIDDQPNNIKSSQDRLLLALKEEGFNLSVISAPTLAEAEKHLAEEVLLDDIDLVAIDYHLGRGNEKGDSVAAAIRKRALYKDIVFYSAISSNELQDQIRKQGVDGVYCTDRERLAETLEGVFRAQIKKVLDIDHCRGIVLGETSDIDCIVAECLRKLVPTLTGEKKVAVERHAVEKLQKRVETSEIARDKYKGSRSLEDLLGPNGAMDTFLRLGLLKKSLVVHYDGNQKAISDALGQYINDVPRERNILAHAKVVVTGGKRLLKGEGQERTREELKEFRKKLLKYRDTFEEIAKLVGANSG